jgi:hypothetical protein
MSEYTLRMWDSCGGDNKIGLVGDEEPTSHECNKACEEWCREGDWGDAGASIPVSWMVTDEEGNEIGSGDIEVDIEIDHDTLIRRAGGDIDCVHDWTGGCRENPSVWSQWGTYMSFATHCRKCGLHRIERTPGSPRNPGDHDTVEYSQPD